MFPVVHSITFDTIGDPYDLARFWSAVLGRPLDDDDKPGDPAAIVHTQPRLLFIRVPEGKTVKNRVHLDFQPVGRTRDEEIDRILGLGATMVADHRGDDDFAQLADPEGNEFCVQRSAAERAS